MVNLDDPAILNGEMKGRASEVGLPVGAASHTKEGHAAV